MSDIVILRVDFLKQFDKYVRDEIGDEDITDYWLQYGIPDGSDEDDLFEIAMNDEQWVDIVNAFRICCAAAEED